MGSCPGVPGEVIATQTKDSDPVGGKNCTEKALAVGGTWAEGEGSARHDFSEFWRVVPFADLGMPSGVGMSALWTPCVCPFANGCAVADGPRVRAETELL